MTDSFPELRKSANPEKEKAALLPSSRNKKQFMCRHCWEAAK